MDPLFYEQVGQALRAEDPRKRAQAIVELGKTGEYGAIRMALSHAKHETKKAILEHIGNMARQAGAAQWADLLRDQLALCRPDEKCRLLFVMRYLDDHAIHLLAAEQFGVENSSVRKAAFTIINHLDKKTKLRLFKNLAMDREIEKRIRAIRGVLAFKHGAVVPILKRALKDAEYDVRRAAYDGLQTLHAAGVSEASAVLDKVPEPTPPAEPTPTPPAVATETDGASDSNDDERMTPIERMLKEGKTCRVCKHMAKERCDKKKMAPNRLWCKHLKKETLPTKTCLRGSW